MEQLRHAKPEELEAVIALSDRTFRPDPGSRSMGTSFSHLLNESNLENLLVAVDEGRIVSLVGLLPSALHLYGCRIPVFFMGSVCTDSDYRGRGLASGLLKLADRKIREAGGAILFVSGGLDIYLRMDCMIVGEMQEFALERGRFEGSNSPAEVLMFGIWDGEAAGELLGVQVREPVHFHRTSETFKRLIENASLLSGSAMKQEVIVARTGGRAEGYLVFGTDDSKEPGNGQVIEFAGPDRVVEAMIRYAFERYGVPQIKLTVPNYRFALKEKLASAGTGFASIPISGTVKVMDAELLWHYLQPYMNTVLDTERNGLLQFVRTGNGYRIGYDGDDCHLDNRGMTKLFFNGMPCMGNGPIKQMLGRIFPLPFDNPYNLNYV